MGLLSDLDDNQIDELFAGQPSREEPFAEIARHLAGARSQLVQAPSRDIQERHLAAMLEAVRVHDEPVATTGARKRVALRARAALVKLGAGATALSLSTAGLAYAGVDLPGRAAEKAFEVVGIELPNQASAGESEVGSSSGKSVSDDVKAVIEGVDATGCEFGHAVAAAAGQNRQDGPKQARGRCAGASTTGAARAEERSDGKSKADEAPRGGKSTGVGKSAEGKARAAEGKARGERRSAGKDNVADRPAAPANGRGSGGGSAEAKERSQGRTGDLPTVPDLGESAPVERGEGKPDGAGKP